MQEAVALAVAALEVATLEGAVGGAVERVGHSAEAAEEEARQLAVAAARTAAVARAVAARAVGEQAAGRQEEVAWVAVAMVEVARATEVVPSAAVVG